MKTQNVVAGLVISICLCVALFALTGATAQHTTISDAIKRAGETVQVPGEIVKDTVGFDAMKGVLRFDIVGINPKTLKADPTQRITVTYSQPKPDSFDSATKLEAIGQVKDGVFVAQNLLIKCPSKYGDDNKSRVADARTGS